MKKPIFMIYEEACPPDQGFAWHCSSFKKWLMNLLHRRHWMRVDWYNKEYWSRLR